jgi:hypothetical protein
MKKLYLFGDSFSLFTGDIKEYYRNDIEFNTHHSLSNDHILKLVKLKLNKILQENIDVTGSTILIQLTVCSRMCVNESSMPDEKELLRKIYSYDSSFTQYGDGDVFNNRYYTLYPNMRSVNTDLMKMVFMPYLGFFINRNELNILNDLLLEVTLLKNLAKSIGINLEYLFYSSDFDVTLNGLNPFRKDKVLLREINSNHIKFGEFNSVQSYIAENHPEYFVSKMDIHFNNKGNKWYINWLKKRYDIGNR